MCLCHFKITFAYTVHLQGVTWQLVVRYETLGLASRVAVALSSWSLCRVDRDRYVLTQH